MSIFWVIFAAKNVQGAAASFPAEQKSRPEEPSFIEKESKPEESSFMEKGSKPEESSFVEKFWKDSLERLAGASDLYRERLEFDAEGNLWMTTRDRIATSDVRYKTIGFTIKREGKAISATQTVRVKLEETKESLTDPVDSRYRYCYFCIRKENIYQNILLCSEEWATELYLNGGMLYLDAIMTVMEKEKVKGSMSYSGVFRGEVYETYEGIAGARDWSDPEALRTHYNKEVYFPGNPDMLHRVPEVEEYSKLLTNGSLVQKENLPEWNSLYLTSETYEVSQAIPSGETVNAEGSIQKFYYQAIFEHIWGTYTFPIVANVHYTLVWDEETHHEESVSILEFYEVKRSYSYWKLKEVSLYYLDNLLIDNTALQEQKRILSTYMPEIMQLSGQKEYLSLPEVNVEVEGGILNGGNRCPSIPYGAVQGKIEAAVPEIKVNNDGFAIDGEVYLQSGWQEKETAAPTALTEERSISVKQVAGIIRPEAENNSFPTNVTAYYKKAGGEETDSSVLQKTNAIEVHTPVVCTGTVTDEKEWNQQVTPTKAASLILGRNFTVEISAEGKHIEQTGYGTRDYAAYVKEYQVKFPFDVSYGTQFIEKNSWITLKEKATTFFLPIETEEENYDVVLRTIAINSPNQKDAEEYANYDRHYYVAETKIPVTAVGRLFDFKITNIIDYPRWQSVFWNVAQKKRTGTCYYAGTHDLNGIRQRENNSLFLCPILKGSHPYNSNAGPVGLGYRVEFSFQTIGQRAGEKMGMSLKPTYYYIQKDGSGRQQVRLYQKDTLEEIDLPFTLESTSFSETGNANLCWSGSCLIPADLYIVPAELDIKSYIQKKGGRIPARDDVFLQGGYLIVNVDLTSYYGAAKNLNYRNQKNEKAGYCNMWKTEGFQTKRTDNEGTVFSFQQGDVFLFDCTNTILKDYDTYGTH
ncbi:MAG: DUF5704 domain-containing protein [Roseburia sp.]